MNHLGLNFDELRSANLARCEATALPLDSWSPTDWACAMAGECGEACNFVKKLRRTDNPDSIYKNTQANTDRDFLRMQVGRELADMIIYADLLASRLDLNLGEHVRLKFNEVSRRVGAEVSL